MARRKIPVRKHHGIRDPLKQLEQKEKSLSKVTNNPPTLNDEQRMSYNFKQFKQIADTTKSGKKVKRSPIGQEDKPKEHKGKKNAPATSGGKSKPGNIKQFSNETDEDYLKRVNRITSASVREAQYEAKYGVSVIRNSKTGEITVQKRPKNEIDELYKQKLKERRQAKPGRRGKAQQAAKPTMDAKTSRELIKRAYKEAAEEADEPSDNERAAPPAEYKRDVFKFGETVHGPPSLITPRKATKNETVPRPGRKANLLLKSLLAPAASGETPAEPQTTPQPKPKTTGVVSKAQLRGKRKELPAATRNMLDNERSKMIDIYRQLKATREAQRQ